MKTKQPSPKRGQQICRFALLTSFLLAASTHSQTVDSFNPGISTAYNPMLLSVNSMTIQTDGKIIAGGHFTTLGGQTRYHIARLNMDGTVDTNFNPGVFSPSDSRVYSLAIQADGKILGGGYFFALGGTPPRSNLARLNSDVTLDTNFNAQATGQIYSLATQPDGKILVGGWFSSLGGQTRTNIGRLNADGTLDTTFTVGVNYDGLFSSVSSIIVQTDGKILVGGGFTNLGGQTRYGIGRLNTNGALDINFNPGSSGGDVNSLAIQANGQILVGGGFTNLAGQTRYGIGRLNTDGSLDTNFNPGNPSTLVNSFALQSDGKILVGGIFSTLAGEPRNQIARLNADGTADHTFNPGANGEIRSLALQSDGKVLVGGKFTTLGGQTRIGIGRINATEPATDNLMFDGSTIIWLRGGSGPEVWRTTFEASTNSTTWFGLGIGKRIVGGWQLTNVFLPTSSTIRARGFVSGGYGNAANWFVESTWPVPPSFIVNDGSFGFLSNQFGFNISGSAGQTIILESSTNSSSWIPLATNTLGSGPFYFGDSSSTNFPQRFYRTRTSSP